MSRWVCPCSYLHLVNQFPERVHRREPLPSHQKALALQRHHKATHNETESAQTAVTSIYLQRAKHPTPTTTCFPELSESMNPDGGSKIANLLHGDVLPQVL